MPTQPIEAVITPTVSTVQVTSAMGSAGQALAVTPSSSVEIAVGSIGGGIQYKVGSAPWVALDMDQGARLAIDLSTTAVLLRKFTTTTASIPVQVTVNSLTQTAPEGEMPLPGPIRQWLAAFRGFEGVPGVMTSPPTITIGANNAVSAITGAANASVGIAATSASIARTNGLWAAATDSAYRRPARAGGRVRFATASNKFEIRLNSQDGYSGVSIKVYEQEDTKGRYVSKALWPAGQALNGNHLVLVDFGDNVQNFAARNAVRVAGGTGYAVGDQITLAGGTNTQPAVLFVTAVNAGAITNVSIKTRGVYSATPANAVAQASTTGAGTGATFTVIWSKAQTTVRDRRFEIEFESNVWFGGLNLPAGDAATPWFPSSRLPKFLTLSDSFGEGFYADYAAGSFSSTLAHLLGLSDAFIRQGVAGRGWAKTGNNVSSDIGGVIALAPDMVAINLGVNDPGFATAAEVQAAVTLHCNTLQAALPNLRLVVTTGWDADTSFQNAVLNGVLAVGDQTRIRGINLQANGIYVGTAWARTSDNVHPNQVGSDYLATRLAPLYLTAFQEMA